MPLERVIITFNRDGTFRGASATDFDDLPVPLTEPALTALFPALNSAAIATIGDKDIEKAALEADHAVAQAALSDIETVLASTPPEKIAARAAEILEKARAGKKTATDKEIAALEQQIADEEARLAELKAKGGTGIGTVVAANHVKTRGRGVAQFEPLKEDKPHA